MARIGNLGPYPTPASSATTIATLTGTAGSAVGPDSNGNVTFSGTNMTITGNAATSTLTFVGGGSISQISFLGNNGQTSSSNTGAFIFSGTNGIQTQGITSSNVFLFNGVTATTGTVGVTQLATDADTLAGVSTTTVLTPSNLTTKLGTQTANAIAVAKGSGTAINWVGPLPNGTLLVGSNSGTPVVASLLAGMNISVVNGPGQIIISALAGGTIGFLGITDNGNFAASQQGIMFFTGTGGPITVSGSGGAGTPGGGTMTIGLAAPIGVTYGGTGTVSLIAHGVMIGQGTSRVNTTTAGTSGQLLIGATGADPVFGTLTSSGASLAYTTSAGTMNIDLTSPVVVSYGGSGRTSLTTHGVLVGEGTSPFNALAVGTSGQVLLGATGADPAFGTLTSSGGSLAYTTSAGSMNIDLTSPVVVSYGGTGRTSLTTHGVLVGEGTSPFNALAVGTSGQVLLGATGADPAFGTLTSSGGSLAYTASAAGLNIDLTSPVVVSYGGTGRTSLTAHGVLIGQGTSPFNTVGPLANGQLLIGSNSGDPVAATLTAGAGVTIVTSPGGIVISAGGSVASAFAGNSGSATPSSGTLNIFGDVFAITTAAQGNTITISLVSPVVVSYGGSGRTSLTAHGVLVGEGTSPFNALAVGSNGQLLVGATGADPAFATLTSSGNTLTRTTSANTINLDLTSPVVVSYGGTGRTSLATGGLLVGAGTNPINALTAGTNGQLLVGSNSGDPIFATLTSSGSTLVYTAGAGSVNVDLRSPVVVSYGGTGRTSLTTGGLLVGEGTNPINALAAGTNGQLLVGSNSGDPIFATLTSSGSTLVYTAGAGSVNVDLRSPVVVSYGGTGRTSLTAHGVLIGQGTSPFNTVGPMTNGQLLIGSNSGDPIAGQLTSSGNTVQFAFGPGSINLEASGVAWNTVTASTGMTVSNGYITNSASLVVLTLPTVASVGSLLRVTGLGTGGWKVAQNASQIIHFGNQDSTSGTGGSVSSTQAKDSFEMLCVVANNEFNVLSSVGNMAIS